MEFRLLKAEEIEVRVATANEKGVSLLLYKDARVDQNILDETVGSMNWQRHHSRDNANCTVSIWDKEKGQWIERRHWQGIQHGSRKGACIRQLQKGLF